MKKASIIVPALAVIAMATGCNKQSNSYDNTSSTNADYSTNSVITNTDNSISNNAGNAWQSTKEGASNAWENTKSATSRAWTDIKDSVGSTSDYTYDKKDEFVSKAQADLDSLNKKIQDLSDKASNNAATNTDVQAKLQEVRDKRAALDNKLTDVKNSTADNWNDTKTAFSNAYNDTKATIKTDWQWLNDKSSQ